MTAPKTNDRAQRPMTDDLAVGLCYSCRHAKRITSSRETEFWRCGRSDTDPRFAKYPPLPVVRCIGYEPEPAPQL